MPKYEIGYILSSGIADDEIPNVTGTIAKSLEASGAKILLEDHWGRKKLAYPIGRTRNGYYAFLSVDLPSEKTGEVEHKLRTQEGVIRFIIVNQETADRKRSRDEEARARRVPASARASVKTADNTEAGEQAAPGEQIDIDAEIEKAISREEEKV